MKHNHYTSDLHLISSFVPFASTNAWARNLPDSFAPMKCTPTHYLLPQHDMTMRARYTRRKDGSAIYVWKLQGDDGVPFIQICVQQIFSKRAKFSLPPSCIGSSKGSGNRRWRRTVKRGVIFSLQSWWLIRRICHGESFRPHHSSECIVELFTARFSIFCGLDYEVRKANTKEAWSASEESYLSMILRTHPVNTSF